MVVDDAKFSGAVISRTLKGAGYLDVRTAVSASEALIQLEKRPVNVLIADWLMPEMDGLELTGRVRQQDEANNHYTYVILLTAKEGGNVLLHAFDSGVDDFINKSAMQQQLLPRIYAADRLAALQNRLLRENQLLVEANQRLRRDNLLDPLTGLGNGQYALRRLEEASRHAQSRGGAVCLMLINLDNHQELRERHDKEILRQIIVAITRRLRALVRPLDIVARISNHEFAVITHQPDIHQCNASTYRRIYDALNVREVKTSKGFITIRSSLCMSAADDATGFPTPETMLATTRTQIPLARESGRLMVIRWRSMRKGDE
jgi:diguanylate cyclase (GGDEF)-like protein